MTGKERIMAALNRQVPDHAPTMEWILSKKVMKTAYGTEDDIEFSLAGGPGRPGQFPWAAKTEPSWTVGNAL